MFSQLEFTQSEISCSSNLFFLIEGQSLTFHLRALWLVLLYLLQCSLLVCCFRQTQMPLEIWCRFLACYFKVLFFLGSSAGPLLVTRMFLLRFMLSLVRKKLISHNVKEYNLNGYDPHLVSSMHKMCRAMHAATVPIHPLVIAGWCGLTTSAFNMLPVGCLDGGRAVQVSSPSLEPHVFTSKRRTSLM